MRRRNLEKDSTDSFLKVCIQEPQQTLLTPQREQLRAKWAVIHWAEDKYPCLNVVEEFTESVWSNKKDQIFESTENYTSRKKILKQFTGLSYKRR